MEISEDGKRQPLDKQKNDKVVCDDSWREDLDLSHLTSSEPYSLHQGDAFLYMACPKASQTIAASSHFWKEYSKMGAFSQPCSPRGTKFETEDGPLDGRITDGTTGNDP